MSNPPSVLGDKISRKVMVEEPDVKDRGESIRDSINIGSLHNVMQVTQFTIAHNTSLIVYNKGYDSNTKELVRKFRPEFEQVFVASDVKSFISFIDSHNNDLEHQEISMVDIDRIWNFLLFRHHVVVYSRVTSNFSSLIFLQCR